MQRLKSNKQQSAVSIMKSNLQANIPNTWMFLVKDDVFIEKYFDDSSSDIVKLRHPGTSEAASFLFSNRNTAVYEIISYSDVNRSWLIGETVKSDGKLYLSTPLDPLFLILPLMSKECHNNAISLDQLLTDEEFPETRRLLKCLNPKSVLLIADQKGDPDLKAFKYNAQKTLRWLEKKVEHVAAELRRNSVHVNDGATSATFVCSTETDELSDKLYVRYAHGIVSQYLEETMSRALATHLQLSASEESERIGPAAKRLAPLQFNITNKKQKIENGSSCTEATNSGITSNLALPTSKPDANMKAPSSKEKARQKAASGSKTIASFFTKNMQ